MRVPNKVSSMQLERLVVENQAKLAHKQVQIASGKNYKQRSEDVASAAEVARLKTQRMRNEQWQENVQTSLNWAKATSVHLELMSDRMHEVRELTAVANSGTVAPGDLRALGEEINAILEDVVQAGNSQFAGKYLFAGTGGDVDPFAATRDADGRIDAVTYNGDESSRKTQISDNVIVNYNVPGVGERGVFRLNDTGGISMIEDLIDFRDELLAGQVPSTASVDEIDENHEHLLARVVDSGVRQRQFGNMLSDLTRGQEITVSSLGKLESLDLTAAIIELNDLQASVQASLSMASRITQLSLVNFI